MYPWLDKAMQFAFLTGNRQIMIRSMATYPDQFDRGMLARTVEKLEQYGDYFDTMRGLEAEAIRFHVYAASHHSKDDYATSMKHLKSAIAIAERFQATAPDEAVGTQYWTSSEFGQ